jgi:hypothetical protein
MDKLNGAIEFSKHILEKLSVLANNNLIFLTKAAPLKGAAFTI